MSVRITLSDSEQRILYLVLRNVADDMEYDGSTDDFRNCGDMLLALEFDEYEELLNVMRKVKPS